MIDLVTAFIGPVIPYIIAGVGVVGALLAAWFRAKSLGRKEQAAKQAAADARAVNTAKQVQTQVDTLKPEDARKELKSWDGH